MVPLVAATLANVNVFLFAFALLVLLLLLLRCAFILLTF